jgi:hypothetical protein
LVAPDAGCDGFCPLGNSVLPDGLMVVFMPPVAPVAPPVPVPVVVPLVPDETLPLAPTPPADAPPPAEPPAPCAKAAVDEIASANPKVIAASFMKSSFRLFAVRGVKRLATRSFDRRAHEAVSDEFIWQDL